MAENFPSTTVCSTDIVVRGALLGSPGTTLLRGRLRTVSVRGASAWLRDRVTVPRRLRDALAQFVTTDFMTSIMTDPKYVALWERCGFRVTRDGDYYKPFPSSQTVHGMNWDQAPDLAGIALNTAWRSTFLRRAAAYQSEYAFPGEPTDNPFDFYLNNAFFLSFDAEILHCMIRLFNPKRIIEVGSGMSTLITTRAATLNRETEDRPTEIHAIEPFPNPTLRAGVPGLTSLIAKPAQQVDLDFFLQLEENDILFIETSHVVKMGEEVVYLYLEVLPRLRKGVIVQIHDIFLRNHIRRNGRSSCKTSSPNNTCCRPCCVTIRASKSCGRVRWHASGLTLTICTRPSHAGGAVFAACPSKPSGRCRA